VGGEVEGSLSQWLFLEKGKQPKPFHFSPFLLTLSFLAQKTRRLSLFLLPV